jgi:hypothetical protein
MTTTPTTITKQYVHEKKRMQATKAEAKKLKKTKTNVIEVGESEEEETARIKWRDLEVHHLIAIQGEMDKEFT